MIRSANRTISEIRPYFVRISLFSAWGAVEKFAKKSAGLAAFLVVGCILIAPFQPVPAQSGGETAFRLRSAEDRIAKLEDLPAQVAKILEHQVIEDERSKAQSEQLTWIQREALIAAAGLILWGASGMINSLNRRTK